MPRNGADDVSTNAGDFLNGRGGFRTCDLSRVKSAQAVRPTALYRSSLGNRRHPGVAAIGLLRPAVVCCFHGCFQARLDSSRLAGYEPTAVGSGWPLIGAHDPAVP